LFAGDEKSSAVKKFREEKLEVFRVDGESPSEGD
jgi:hypothetical protein